MTNISPINYQDVDNIYGERTWIEYGFRQCKSERGWEDFHLTNYVDIAKWWKVISCAFYISKVTVHSPGFSWTGKLISL